MKPALFIDTPAPTREPNSPPVARAETANKTVATDHVAATSNLSSALRFNLRYAVFLAAILGANIFHPVIPTLVAAGCGVAAFISPLRTLQAFTVLAVVRYLNPELVDPGPLSGLMSWVALLCATVRYGPGLFLRLPPTSIPLLSFGIIVLVTTQFVSPAPVISSLKLIAFCVTAVVLLAVAQKTSSREREQFIMWCFNLAVVVLVLSVPFFFRPAIGFAKNGWGFQGILSHPQAFGVFFAPMTVCLITKFIFAKKRSWFDAAILLAFIITITLSRTRTSALAVVCSVFVVYLILLFRANRRGQAANKGTAIVITTALCLIGGSAFFFIPEVHEQASQFVFKRGTANVEKEFMQSRGQGAVYQFTHFLQSPIWGHGFGIPSSGEFSRKPTVVYGIPISAPTEKGFLPTAILEETGLLGTSLFVWWLLASLRLASRDRSGVPACLLTAGIFVNFGEMSLFSLNSLGLLFFTMMSVAIAQGAQYETQNQPAR